MTAVRLTALPQAPTSTDDTHVPVGHAKEFAEMVYAAATPPAPPPPAPAPVPARRQAYQYD